MSKATIQPALKTFDLGRTATTQASSSEDATPEASESLGESGGTSNRAGAKDVWLTALKRAPLGILGFAQTIRESKERRDAPKNSVKPRDLHVPRVLKP